MGRACQVHNIPNFDCIDCRTTACIRQAADGRIEVASTVLVDALESYVELVLNATWPSRGLGDGSQYDR